MGRGILALALMVALPVAPGAADDSGLPRHYAKLATWFETLVRTLEAAASDEGLSRTFHPLPDFGRDGFTVSAWVRTASDGTVLAKAPREGDWPPQGKAFFVRSGRLCFDIGWVGVVTSQREVADASWHHVAVAGTGGSHYALYVDGEPDAAADLPAGSDVPGHVLKIGFTSSNFPGPSFAGEIDDLRIYASALSAAEIVACAKGDAPDEELVARWAFDGDLRDSEPGERDATPVTGIAFAEGRLGKAISLPGGGVYLVVDSGDGVVAWDALWAQLEADFPDNRSRTEMAWERGDGIWPGWQPGDWDDLARRYNRVTGITTDIHGRDAALQVRRAYLVGRERTQVHDLLWASNLPGLSGAVRYLARRYPDVFPPAQPLLDRISDVEKRAQRATSLDEANDLVAEIDRIRAQALVRDNPLMRFGKLLFVKRYTYQSNHYYTDYINGCRYFGGNLCALDLGTGEVVELAPSLAGGIFGRFDLSFDGKRVLFDHKRAIGEGFRIWEVGVDGTGLRQVTFPPVDESLRIATYKINEEYQHHTDDMQPCYLPDGGICFISTRCEFGILCDSPDLFTATVLYRMDMDGGHMEKLTNSSVSEASPCLTNDGRILYTRWEYVDKGAVCVKCLWAMNPDGTGSEEVFGNDIALPPTLLHGLPIPGCNDRFVVMGTPHCPQSGVGAVIRVDTSKDIRTRAPMTYITPDVDIREEGGFHHLRNGRWVKDELGPLYADAYPLDDSFYLVSCNPDTPWNDPTGYGLYLIDEFGDRVPIYRDPDTSCWQPVPLVSRPTPPPWPCSQHDGAASATGTLIMANVYEGLSGVERRTIKYLRVMEQVPRPWSARRRWDGDLYDQQHAVITKGTHLGLKVLRGIVPVEEDGSAHFTVPADRNLYFQALDEDFMEVQRMRTYINVRPGETRSCIGCHTPKPEAPPQAMPQALTRPPSELGPQPGEVAPRPLYYPTDVQPVLDRHCVSCHSGESPAAGLDLSGEMTELFSRSYESILARNLVPIIGENHPKVGNAEPVPPRTLGSHASRLIALVRDGHQGVRLTREELVELTTWVDSNGQFYGSYFGRRNLMYRDLPDFRPVPTIESALGQQP